MGKSYSLNESLIAIIETLLVLIEIEKNSGMATKAIGSYRYEFLCEKEEELRDCLKEIKGE